jgi:hypothetical protein
LLLASDLGLITKILFVDWLIHFHQLENILRENPVLLISDNLSAHMSLAAIDKCLECGVRLLSFLHHSSHKLQPIDRDFFGPLTVAYSQEYNKWHVRHRIYLSRSITLDRCLDLLTVELILWMKLVSPSNAEEYDHPTQICLPRKIPHLSLRPNPQPLQTQLTARPAKMK